MKPKQILFLALLLAILAGVFLYRHFQKVSEHAPEEFVNLSLNFDAGKVGKIQIGKGGGSEKNLLLFTLVKNEAGQEWRIPDFYNARVDKSKVDQLFKSLQELKGELRANDPALFSDFKISDNDALRILFFDKDWKNQLTLFIGGKQPSPGSIFVRRGDSNQIYVTDSNLLHAIGINGDPADEKPTMDFWAALNLTHFEPGDVDHLEARRFKDGREIVTVGVVRVPNASDSTKKMWKYSREGVPFAVDAAKINQFLETLQTWRGSKALDPKAKDYGFAKPFWQMKIGLGTNPEIVITATPQDTATAAHFVQVSGESVVFEFPDYLFQNMDIDDSKFFVDNPLGVNPETTEKLIIHAGDKELDLNPREKKKDELTNYLNDLKGLTVTRLLFDPADTKMIKSSNRSWLEIHMAGKNPLVLEVGQLLADTNRAYAAHRKDNTQSFAIPEATYKKLFENLERLSDPKA